MQGHKLRPPRTFKSVPASKAAETAWWTEPGTLPGKRAIGGPGDTAAAAGHLPPRGEAEGVLSGHSDLLSRISCFSLSRKQATVPSRRFGCQRRHWAAEFPLESRSQNPVCVSLVTRRDANPPAPAAEGAIQQPHTCGRRLLPLSGLDGVVQGSLRAAGGVTMETRRISGLLVRSGTQSVTGCRAHV